MALSKTTRILALFILGLSVACVALLVSLVIKTNNSSESDGYRTNDLVSVDPELPHVPIISESTDEEFETYDEPYSEPEDGNTDLNDGNKVSDGEDDNNNFKFPWEKNVRLPRTVLPLHYDLYLHPDLETGLFSGKVSIEVDNQMPTDHFLVHTKYLDILCWKVRKNGLEQPITEAFEYKPNEYFVIKMANSVSAGKYVIDLEFKGNLTRGIVGFYKSEYTNKGGVKIPIATSKFQPTYARRAFPCFDEPSFKSTFTVTLIRPSEKYIALSNMPVDSEKSDAPENGLTEVKFEKSVPMVTYLACFIVCDFEYEEKLTAIHQTKFRVYATSNQKERMKYALDIGANITDYFEDYFEIPYPLPKQDMIAIPDFVSGAMEHWGLITYRETNLLFDELESSPGNQQRVATVISHELAHQWFGNLVTLAWWDDLWLNEGFASYMEYKGVAQYHQNWDMESQFLTNDLHSVMNLDATINSHPIVQAVDHPDQITEIFDSISYSKGASVLRMLENFMSPDKFRIGIKRFLSKFTYQNAVTSDLWETLSMVSNSLNISKIMDTWTRQMGYPLVTVEKVKSNEYRLTQSRFLLDQSASEKSPPSPYNYTWDIPITWITNDDSEPDQKWLGSKDPFILITVPSGTQWVKFNVGQYGYYRVKYSEEEWQNLAQVLQNDHTVFSTKDRAHLLNDAFKLAESRHLSYSIPLSMTEYLTNEKSLIPWKTLYSEFVSMEHSLEKTETYPLYRKYVSSLVIPHYDRLKWKNDGLNHVEKLSQVIILNLACRNGHQPCLEEAGNKFLAWIKDKSAYIPPNVRSLVYQYGMLHKGDEDTWSTMLKRYQAETNAQEKSKLLRGLAWIDQPWIVHRFLTLAKNESIVRSQDYMICLRYIAQNPIGLPIVWNFLRDEWSYLVERFSLNDRYLGRMPKYIGSTFASQFRLNEMKDFFKKYPDAGAGARARKQAIEAVENNINWLENHETAIRNWLEENSSA